MSKNKTIDLNVYEEVENDKVIKVKRLKRQNKTMEERINETFESWVGYWRANPHRFITDYLGLPLYDFQRVLIYLMNKYPFDVWAASRGLKYLVI